jgi:NAD+ synthase
VEQIYNQIQNGIQDYFKKHNFQRAVLGLSGGVDSALCLKLCVDALGARNVFALLMPELGVTNSENTMHAQRLAEFFEVTYYKVPINPFLVDFTHVPWKSNDMAYANTKARIRMTMLYNFANTYNALVIGTSNKSELLLGYGTKFGDLAADLEIIGDLYKTEVWHLADFLGLPPEIISKAPSAELKKGQTDEEDLGAEYKDLDNVLRNLGLGFENIVSKGLSPTLVRRVMALVKKNEHKLSTPPIIMLRKN